MKRSLLLALFAVLSLAPSAYAQNRSFDLTANAVYFDLSSEGTFENIDDPADIAIDGDIGYGISANIFFGNRFSTEFAIARVQPGAGVSRRRVAGQVSSDLEITPLTAVLQFHFAPNSVIDPYIGGGVAYVLFDDLDANKLNGVQRIEFEDDYGFAINAGLGIRLGQRFALVVDAKYVPVDSAATAVFVTGPNSEARIDINPVIVSAGLSLRF